MRLHCLFLNRFISSILLGRMHRVNLHRANKVRRTHPCLARAGRRSRGRNWTKMVMSRIGELEGLYALEVTVLIQNRAKIVIYDLEKDVRFTITQNWDRSPDSLAVSIICYCMRVRPSLNSVYALPSSLRTIRRFTSLLASRHMSRRFHLQSLKRPPHRRHTQSSPQISSPLR